MRASPAGLSRCAAPPARTPPAPPARAPLLQRRDGAPTTATRSVVCADRRSPRDPIVPPAVKINKQDMVDLNTYLLRSRVIFVGSRITDESAMRIVASLMAFEAIDPTTPITMYINSLGGSPYSAVGVVDTMRALGPPIRTVAMGMVGTTAALLLAAGTKGERYAMPSARVMLHQPIGGAAGSADEVNITATELHRTMRVVNAFLSEFTGRDEEEIEAESDRPFYMGAREAVAFGLVDAVLPSRGTGVAPEPPAEVLAALGKA